MWLSLSLDPVDRNLFMSKLFNYKYDDKFKVLYLWFLKINALGTYLRVKSWFKI
jgi:hypothetical protein